MRHNQCNFGRNQALTNDNILEAKIIFVPISPHIAAGWLKHHSGTPNSCAIMCGRLVSVMPPIIWGVANPKLATYPPASTIVPYSHSAVLRVSWVIQTSRVALPSHAPEPAQVWSTSEGKDRHFTHDTKTVFRLYLAWHSRGVTATSDMAHTTHAIKPVNMSLESGSNEGLFTLQDETVFRVYLASHSSGVTQTSHVALTVHALEAVRIWWKSVRK
jgi:hypothetical protein